MVAAPEKAKAAAETGQAKGEADTPEQQPKAPPKPKTVPDEIRSNLVILGSAVEHHEPRLTARVLRTLPSIRKKLTSATLRQIIEGSYAQASSQRQLLLSLLPEPSASESTDMDVDRLKPPPAADATVNGTSKPTSGTATPAERRPPVPTADALPEVDIYTTLLVIVFLLDHHHHEQGLALADHTVNRIQSLNRRTLDQLAGRVFFYYARFHELAGDDTFATIRPTLLAAQRTAALRHDSESQATLLNLLMRNYFHYNLFDQADKLVAKTTFPDAAGNPQLARWSYYLGRIRAIQLSYTEAHQQLQQAIRRAPSARVAPGFLQTVHKLAVVVQLLTGDIPDRAIFREPVLKRSLMPYLSIAQTVRVGDLPQFTEVVSKHAASFKADANYTLILRLRHNVIKAALRTISLAYSRIPLSAISTQLGLESEEEAEYVVAKAIRDGVVDGRVNHEHGSMEGRESVDVYATSEPARAFHERIAFCIGLHNESVRAMRFPLQAHKKELATVDEAREREREMAKGIVDGELDDDDDGFGPAGDPF